MGRSASRADRQRWRRWRRQARTVGLLAGSLLLVSVLVASLWTSFVPTMAVPEDAAAAARRFLDTYVGEDGRVIRRDQGGDTVGEGQAYALLLAVALGDAEMFERVWRWTDANLRRDDGLLAHRWVDGAVDDPQAATDADLDAAHALLLAAERFGEPRYRAAALAIGDAIVAVETATPGGDEPVLVAGPWATGDPAVVNPSYFSPLAYRLLGNGSGNSVWRGLRRSSYEITATGLQKHPLPPDWLLLREDGSQRAVASPDDTQSDPAFGLDAARLPIRFAVDCDDRGREIAARLWDVFEDVEPGGLRLRHTLDGAPAHDARHAVMLVSAAAMADAAGDAPAAGRLLDEAEQLDREHPTYYGSAWVALGRILLASDVLRACP